MQPLNRYIHNETNNQTGFKACDFGRGGRTYVNTRRVQRSEGSLSQYLKYGRLGWCAGAVCSVLAIAVIVFSQRNLNAALALCSEMESNAVPLDSSAVVSALRGGLPLAHASGTLHLADGGLRDEYFGRAFGAAIEARRVPEYCQWSEIRHDNRKVVGREPDKCRATGARCYNVGAAECENRKASSCARAGEVDGDGTPCCRMAHGADIVEESTTYSYVKGWNPARINSLLFDNTVSFHNPQRDPAPPAVWASNADVELRTASSSSAVAVAAPLLAPVFGPWAALRARSAEGASVPARALADGFRELDGTHYLSRLAHDGAEGKWAAAAKAGAAYLLEGVVDASAVADLTGLSGLLDGAGLGWLAKGTCNAGDVRAKHEARALPRDPVTLVGRLKASGSSVRLADFEVAGQASGLVARRGVLSVAELTAAVGADARSEANWARAAALLLLVAGVWAAGPRFGKSEGPYQKQA